MDDGGARPARRPHQFSISLPDELMAELRAHAARKAVAPATLARLWIAERLERERKADAERADAS